MRSERWGWGTRLVLEDVGGVAETLRWEDIIVSSAS